MERTPESRGKLSQPSIMEIMQKRLMDTIKKIAPVEKWKVVIVDSFSKRIIEASCKMDDILGDHVLAVENIEMSRQDYKDFEAIYFLTPCRESIQRLIGDFADKPKYKCAHVHFTRGVDDDLFKKLVKSNAGDYFRCLKEIYVDFSVVEPSVFSVDAPASFHTLFGKSSDHSKDEVLKEMAQRLLCVFATLGESPIIRYQRQEDPKKRFCYKLATYLQDNVHEFCRANPDFPPRKNPPQPPATLLIVDRSVDPAAPLLHEFTYQAMVNDLLPVSDNSNGTGIVYSYEYNKEDDSLGTTDAAIDENDEIYTSIRHSHISECIQDLLKSFKEFSEENNLTRNHGAGESKSTEQNLREMKKIMSNLPQYQELKTKYSTHISIAQECMSYFEKNKLNSIGSLEQNMATGETPDGEIPKTVVLDMVPLLDDPKVSPVDKVRLLMLYIISKKSGISKDDRGKLIDKGGIFEEDKRKLMEHAKLSDDLRNAINNLNMLGVKVTRVRQEKPSLRSLHRRKVMKNEEETYQLSRYKPAVKEIMEAQLEKRLGDEELGFINDADRRSYFDGRNQRAEDTGSSLRTTKFRRAETIREPTGPKLIVFVIGGLTYSEMRSAYEAAEKYGRTVYIGTTHILRPGSFVNEMSMLGTTFVPSKPKMASSLQPVISSNLAEPPRTLAQSRSQTSLSSRSVDSGTSSNNTTDKKKKGLMGKLFR